jgi:hypothetical protein
MNQPRTTYTIVSLPVPKYVYDYISQCLREAGYDGYILEDGVIDLHGIGITSMEETAPNETDAEACSCPQHGAWVHAEDVQTLTRRLDRAVNGQDMAVQASLCDVVKQVEGLARDAGDPLIKALNPNLEFTREDVETAETVFVGLYNEETDSDNRASKHTFSAMRAALQAVAVKFLLEIRRKHKAYERANAQAMENGRAYQETLGRLALLEEDIARAAEANDCRDLQTTRRRAAVEQLIADGWRWDGRAWWIRPDTRAQILCRHCGHQAEFTLTTTKLCSSKGGSEEAFQRIQRAWDRFKQERGLTE